MSGRFSFSEGRIRARAGLDQIYPPGVTFWDDFLGDTLSTDDWLATLSDGTGTTSACAISATAGPTTGHGGWVSLSPTGSTDTAVGVELGFGADGTPASNFKANRATTRMGLIFEARINVTSAVTSRFNVGLTDDPTEGSGLAMSTSATSFTTNDADGALWVYDTAATTAAFHGLTVSGGTDSAAGTATAVAGAVPTAGTAMILRIELDSSGNAWFYQDGVSKGKATVGGASLKAIGLTPYLAVGWASGVTDGGALEADYVFVSSPR